MMSKLLNASCAVAVLATVSCAGQNGQMMSGAMSSLGGGMGGDQPVLASLLAAGINSVLAQMIQNLNANQQQQRQAALQQAAAGPVGAQSSWAAPNDPPPAASASPNSPPPAPKVTKAKYVNKGIAKNDQGQTCKKVLETITLPDGKTGTSEELVCPT